MDIADEGNFLAIWLEGLLYGLYSGLFAMYLQCHWQSKKSGAAILFSAVCLLYALATATFVSDLVDFIINTRVGTLSAQVQIDSQPMLFHISIAQGIANGGCDFLAQCILIYRCWIVWGKDIRVVIIPSILAIAYLATWLGQLGAATFVQGLYEIVDWGSVLGLTGLVASMVVNALVTGLIVFKILKVFLRVNPILVGLTLDSTGGTKLRHAVFVIIESGMALFVIQLIRLVFTVQPVASAAVVDVLNFFIVIHQMFNGITPTIILVRVSMKLSFDDTESFKEATESLRFNNPQSDLNTSSSMPPQLSPHGQESLERSEDT